ncbi:TPA: site-specific integrase [Pseudomonas aeruginosa]
MTLLSANRNSRAALKAYDVLFVQPVTASGLSKAERDAIVISAIVNDRGETLVLSRFGDARWDLRPFFDQSNVNEGHKYVSWDFNLPPEMIDDCKAVAYAWFKRGLPGSKPPVARGITTLVSASVIPFIRWLSDLELERFSDVRPIHISNYIHHCKSESLRPMPLYSRLRIIDFLWIFSAETLSPLQCFPWGDSSLWRVSGIGEARGTSAANKNTGRTDIIPPDDQAKIFNYCEQIVHKTKEDLKATGIDTFTRRSPKMIRCRDAVLYIASITSGMRNEEVIGIEVGAWRKEVVDGVTYCWVTTTEHKTGKGRVDYLVPELTLDALNLFAMCSTPMRRELEAELSDLELSCNSVDSADLLLRLEKARKDSKRLFLCLNGYGNKAERVGHIEVLSAAGSNEAFKRVAKAAGSDWPLRTHQCRRTYARCFVESRMGRTSLVFLKWQFKHSSMSMTQLYASNPLQDLTLFDEILQQMTEFKIDLIESWLDDQPLAGGVGERIMELRAIPIKDRSALLAQTAPHANIRATGHGWCIATERGCGGAGLYEATRCPGCKHSVIDETFATTWQGIYSHQLELMEIDDAGPAVRQRAKRDMQVAFDVISSLGLSPLDARDSDPTRT